MKNQPYRIDFLPIRGPDDIEIMAQCLAQRTAQGQDCELLLVTDQPRPTSNQDDFRAAAEQLLGTHQVIHAAIRNRMVADGREAGFAFRADDQVQAIITVPALSRKDIWTVIAEQEREDQTRATDDEIARSMAAGGSA